MNAPTSSGYPQAALRTDGIRLVPLSDEHLELEVELDFDPEVMRYLTGSGRTHEQVERHRLRHAFEDLDQQRMFALTTAANVASRATMAAAGLRHIPIFEVHPADFPAGAEHGGVEYTITGDEWRAVLWVSPAA